MQIVIQDIYPMHRDAISIEITHAIPGASIVSAGSLSAVIDILSTTFCDLILIDTGLPDLGGSDGIRQVVAASGGAPVLVMSNTGDYEEMITSIAAGARAFLPKTLPGPVFVAAMLVVTKGGSYVPAELLADQNLPVPPSATPAPHREASVLDGLSERYREMLRLVTLGASNKEIALRVTLQEVTVKLHLSRIFRVIGTRNRTQAAAWAARSGLVGA